MNKNIPLQINQLDNIQDVVKLYNIMRDVIKSLGYPVSVEGNINYSEFSSIEGFRMLIRINPNDPFKIFIIGSKSYNERIVGLITRDPHVNQISASCQEGFSERIVAEFVETVESKMNEIRVFSQAKQNDTGTDEENITISSKYDVFVSHASANKVNFVKDLVSELSKTTSKVWYDENMIKWGDDLLREILKGLNNTEFAIIVFSKDFFGRKWTEFELEKLLTKQNKEGKDVVLPILYDCTDTEFIEKYPKLSGIKFIEAKNFDIKDITIMFAQRLIERLKGLK